tara:strand:+ start:330 stop:1817 length:1488 start_codon:yes stop_codon:yes gene_type:complete
MSSIKQEVAAILMDYTDKIPEQDYMDILNRLGEIPDHKDPKKASEIQVELDKANKKIESLEDENDIFSEENDDLVESLSNSENRFNSLAHFYNSIMEKRPTVCNDSILLFDISNKTTSDIETSIHLANEFVDNLKKGLENLNSIEKTTELYRFMNRTRISSGEGVGDTEDIVSSITTLFDELDIQDSNVCEEKEDTEENLEISIELNKEFEDRMNDNMKEIYSEFWREAIQFVRAEKFQGAIIKYREIIDRFPESYDAYYRLAILVDKTAQDQEDFDTAMGYYLTSASINTKNYSQCYNNIGIILEDKKDFIGAEDAYKKAILFDEEKGKRCDDIHFNLADLYQKQLRIQESINEYMIVLKSNPHDIAAKESIMKLLNIKFQKVRRRLVFDDIIKFNGSKLEVVNTIQSRACLDCLVKRLINNFDCKINNYYGSLLLHENNYKYTKNIIQKGYEKMCRKMFLRDTRIGVHKSKEKEWNKITKLVNLNLFNYERIM